MKTIVNYSKYYIHDNNVYNIKNERMSLYKDRDGYYRVGLVRDDGIRKTLGLHRLIYAAHNGFDVSNIGIIDHIDNNKENNDISNLREVSHSLSNVSKVNRKVYFSINYIERKIFQFDNLDLAKSKIGIDNYKPSKAVNISNDNIILTGEVVNINLENYFIEITESICYKELVKTISPQINMSEQRFKQVCPKIAKSTNESFIYRNNKKFSEFLHCGLSSIQNALLKNVKRCRGFEFEYLDFFYEVGHEIVKL